MADHLPGWVGDIHKLLPNQYCWIIVTIVAVLCGAAIGSERRKRQKPAGLHTMILICLGASVFTQGGLLIAGGTSDPARIAAQVVTGVGFLGAGPIIRGAGLVTGFTTAATDLGRCRDRARHRRRLRRCRSVLYVAGAGHAVVRARHRIAGHRRMSLEDCPV